MYPWKDEAKARTASSNAVLRLSLSFKFVA